MVPMKCTAAVAPAVAFVVVVAAAVDLEIWRASIRRRCSMILLGGIGLAHGATYVSESEKAQVRRSTGHENGGPLSDFSLSRPYWVASNNGVLPSGPRATHDTAAPFRFHGYAKRGGIESWKTYRENGSTGSLRSAGSS